LRFWWGVSLEYTCVERSDGAGVWLRERLLNPDLNPAASFAPLSGNLLSIFTEAG